MSSENRLNAHVAHPARRYDYWLGGKDNFEADRASGDAIEKLHPNVRVGARENRAFMVRAAAHLTRDKNIRQFLDIGCGLPFSPNLHEVVQAHAPESRIVCVDNDPLIMAHVRAMHASHPDGMVEEIEEDFRNPHRIINHERWARAFRPGEPIALFMVALLHFLPDHEAYYSVARLVHALPGGSYVVLSHADQTLRPATDLANPDRHGHFYPRSLPEVALFLDQLIPLDPGIVSVVDWLPSMMDGLPEGYIHDPEASAEDVCMYGVIARKP